MHLNAVELIDVAEGTRSEASAPHLASCDECRRQLTDLRAMMSTAAAMLARTLEGVNRLK